MTGLESLLLPDWRTAPYRTFGPWLALEVRGDPKPQGSKSYKGKTKAGRPILAESSAALKPWRSHVQLCLEEEIARLRAAHSPAGPMGIWPIEGVGIALDLTFTMPKPKAAPKTRRTLPVTQPDVDKLARAICDAGTAAGVWRDDSQVIELAARKVYPLEAWRALEVPGVYISVSTIGTAIG